MRTLKFKAQPKNAFFATVNQTFGGSSQLPTMFLNRAQRFEFDYRALGSSRKMGGAAEHLIDGSEKRTCQLTLNVIERRSNSVNGRGVSVGSQYF